MRTFAQFPTENKSILWYLTKNLYKCAAFVISSFPSVISSGQNQSHAVLWAGQLSNKHWQGPKATSLTLTLCIRPAWISSTGSLRLAALIYEEAVKPTSRSQRHAMNSKTFISRITQIVASIIISALSCTAGGEIYHHTNAPLGFCMPPSSSPTAKNRAAKGLPTAENHRPKAPPGQIRPQTCARLHRKLSLFAEGFFFYAF